MSAAVVPAVPRGEPGRSYKGHTRISTAALTSVAQLAAAEAFDVDPALVRVTWSDDAGDLALSLTSPMTAPSLQKVVLDPGKFSASGNSVIERTVAAKSTILTAVEYLAGSKLSRVDIRISGLLVDEERRVQ